MPMSHGEYHNVRGQGETDPVMANITMFEVREKRIHNEEVGEMMGNCYTIHQTMEIRRLRLLEKLAAMPETRNPREDRAKRSAKHMYIL
eukprot:scaffold2184_cov128-Cylindrotheca_fusiformis.AAC.12